MTDQKNPPRAQGVGIGDILKLQLMGQTLTDGLIQDALRQEYARGRTEALAELRAVAEPIYQVWYDYEGWNDLPKAEWERSSVSSNDKRIVYLHPPVPREAELAAALRDAEAALAGVVGGRMSQYQARNGRWVTIEADDGERCDIIHSDITTECEGALDRVRSAIRARGETA